jgi:DhnA family fructose-bisphosphate aldolase class Ia
LYAGSDPVFVALSVTDAELPYSTRAGAVLTSVSVAAAWAGESLTTAKRVVKTARDVQMPEMLRKTLRRVAATNWLSDGSASH